MIKLQFSEPYISPLPLVIWERNDMQHFLHKCLKLELFLWKCSTQLITSKWYQSQTPHVRIYFPKVRLFVTFSAKLHLRPIAAYAPSKTKELIQITQASATVILKLSDWKGQPQATQNTCWMIQMQDKHVKGVFWSPALRDTGTHYQGQEVRSLAPLTPWGAATPAALLLRDMGIWLKASFYRELLILWTTNDKNVQIMSAHAMGAWERRISRCIQFHSACNHSK